MKNDKERRRSININNYIQNWGKGETSRLPNLTCHLHAVPIKFILNFTNNNVRRKFQIRGPKLFIVTYKWRILNQGVPCKYYKTSQYQVLGYCNMIGRVEHTNQRSELRVVSLKLLADPCTTWISQHDFLFLHAISLIKTKCVFFSGFSIESSW